MQIKKVTDPEFRKYGRVLAEYDFSEIVKKMEETPLPEGTTYKPSEPILEALPIMDQLQTQFFGELPIEIGYCNGHNHYLNGVEYHRSSEINIAATDIILILGWQPDITDDFSYDASKAEAFLVPKGTGVEMYATTLHLAPCSVGDNGFRCVVVLPKGTNVPLEKEHSGEGEDKLLRANNKWLIGSEEVDYPAGVHKGMFGKRPMV